MRLRKAALNERDVFVATNAEERRIKRVITCKVRVLTAIPG